VGLVYNVKPIILRATPLNDVTMNPENTQSPQNLWEVKKFLGRFFKKDLDDFINKNNHVPKFKTAITILKIKKRRKNNVPA
jgi:hypothetical protein